MQKIQEAYQTVKAHVCVGCYEQDEKLCTGKACYNALKEIKKAVDLQTAVKPTTREVGSKIFKKIIYGCPRCKEEIRAETYKDGALDHVRGKKLNHCKCGQKLAWKGDIVQ